MKLRYILPLLCSTVLINAASPEVIFQTNCASCHGTKGENNALGMSHVIQGMSVDALMEAINAFATDTREGAQVAKMVKKSFVKRSGIYQYCEVANSSGCFFLVYAFYRNISSRVTSTFFPRASRL